MASKEEDTSFNLFEHKDFTRSLHKQYRIGGLRNQKAKKVLQFLGGIQRGLAALDALKTTDNGETRIKNCVKYDLGDGFRLLTIRSYKTVLFCFVGNHEECDSWLDSNAGLIPTRNDSNILETGYLSSSDTTSSVARSPIPSSRPLLELLDEEAANQLLEKVPVKTIGKLSNLEGIVQPEKVSTICEAIVDPQKRNFVQDVFLLLAGGDERAARQRISLEHGLTVEVDELSDSELMEVADGDTIRRIRIGSKEHEEWLTRFSRNAGLLEWLMFLHPEQRVIVEEDFSGPAQLSGVSGAGKTCVAVKRALRLAEAAGSGKLLIVTLNKSLAGLIRLLVLQAAPSESVASRIEVASFFELCQKLLHQFEPSNKLLYVDVTWKLNEHIDEVFREFYRCWQNNADAAALLPLHHSLTSQGIFAESYLREEFDWIRSALPERDRLKYLALERVGRKYRIQESWRQLIWNGLTSWERKMLQVGVIDYLGLTAALSKHEANIVSFYDHILIDEAQDFGTAELSILRRLTKEGPNDIFLCGDVAQHVLPKHRHLKQAGIDIIGRQRKITRNYRNSRQILEAAYAVLFENLEETLIDTSDLEILDPKYSNRSSPEPLVLAADSLGQEIVYARTLATEHLDANSGDSVCIAIAGYSLQEIQQFGEKLGLPVLDGSRPPHESPLVLSDLEQTKGYEFNLMVVLNCEEGILPPADTPKEEAFRYGCRLYVAMTRARDQLYLSYHGVPSSWLTKAKGRLTFENWSAVVAMNPCFVSEPPSHMTEMEEATDNSLLGLTGRQFNYTHAALGLPTDALIKLDELVDGVGMIRGTQRVRWRTVDDARQDLERSPVARNLFGPRVQAVIRERLEELVVQTGISPH